jgi:DNA-binding XRE family transcriptional regulator
MTTKRLLPALKKRTGSLTFGMFMGVARRSLGLNQTEMAKKLGIARGTLCDIEKGRQLVSTTLAVKVARKAGLSEELAVRACLQDQVNKVKLKKKVELVA